MCPLPLVLLDGIIFNTYIEHLILVQHWSDECSLHWSLDNVEFVHDHQVKVSMLKAKNLKRMSENCFDCSCLRRLNWK